MRLTFRSSSWAGVTNENLNMRMYILQYSGTSLIRSHMGLPKSDLNGEVTVLQGVKLHCGIQFGTENG